MRKLFSFGIGVFICANFAFAQTSKKTAQTSEEIDPEAIIVHPTDNYYPVEELQDAMRTKVHVQKRFSPWYERKHRERARIFKAGGMEARIQKDNWRGLEKNLFLQDLDYKGARGIASQYKQFTLPQLQKAEAELRRVKAEP